VCTQVASELEGDVPVDAAQRLRPAHVR
jgi:hypothetical protein